MPVRSPFFDVKVEGHAITPWISAITLTEDDRQADSVSLTIPDPAMVYADVLFEGSVMEVDLGYSEPDQHALMLRAIITRVEVSYGDNGAPSVTIKGSDRSILMGLEQKKHVWRNLKVSDVVRQIGNAHQFESVHVELTPDPRLDHHPLYQDSKTDLQLLQDLAKKYKAKCFVELDAKGKEVLYFIPERRIVRSQNRAAELLLDYRLGAIPSAPPHGNLTSFSPSFDGNDLDRLQQSSDIDRHGRRIDSQKKQPPEVVVWKLTRETLGRANPKEQHLLRALYEAGSQHKPDFQKKLAAPQPTAGKVATDQADLDVGNQVSETRTLGMSASGSTFGNIWLRAKANVTVRGVHARFAGSWYVSSVTHRVDNNGYRSDFRCVR